MNSPYDVLGISPLASEKDIKNAYKKLSEKYYSKTDSTLLKKMDELNAAYDELMSKKRASATKTGGMPAVSEFSDVRKLILGGRLSDAEEILDSVRSLARGGEWNYLKALILSKKGLFKEAYTYIERALEKDSLSDEFNALYQKLRTPENDVSDAGNVGSILRRVLGGVWGKGR